MVKTQGIQRFLSQNEGIALGFSRLRPLLIDLWPVALPNKQICKVFVRYLKPLAFERYAAHLIEIERRQFVKAFER